MISQPVFKLIFPKIPWENINANILLPASLLLNYGHFVYKYRLFASIQVLITYQFTTKYTFISLYMFPFVGCFYLAYLSVCVGVYSYLLCTRLVTITTVTFLMRRKMWKNLSLLMDTFLFFRICMRIVEVCIKRKCDRREFLCLFL